MSRERLIALWQATIEGWPGAFRQRLASNMSGTIDRAGYDAANSAIDALYQIRVMADAPDSPPFRVMTSDGGSGVQAVGT